MLRQERIAVSLDPLAPNPRFNVGWEQLVQRRYPEAVAVFDQVLEQTPDYAYARFHLALANLYAGRYDTARSVWHAAAVQVGQDPVTVEALIAACADPALRPDALRRVAGVDRIGILPLGEVTQAFWYALLGAREPAIASLQRWVAGAPPGQSFIGMRYLRMPAFDAIRDDPRFKAALRQMGLPYVPQAAGSP